MKRRSSALIRLLKLILQCTNWISKANALIEYGNGEEAKKCLDKASKIDSKYDFSQTLTKINKSESSD